MNDVNTPNLITRLRIEAERLDMPTFLRAFQSVLKIVSNLEKRIDARLAQIKDGYTPIKGKDYFDGKPGVDGKTPTKQELTALITPLIPAPIKGEDGVSVDVEQALTAIEERLPALGMEVRNSLELLPEGERLAIEAIEGLRQELDDLKKKGAGGMHTIAYSRGQIKLYDLSDQLDGVTKTFSMPAFWRVITVQSTSTPNAFRPTVDYTVDASVPSITFTSQIDAGSTLAAGQSLLVTYAEP